MVFKMFQRLLTTLAATLLMGVATACSPTVMVHGNMVSEHKMDAVTPAVSTKGDVENAWGPPTNVAPFDPNTWYYVGEKDSQKGVFAPEVDKRQIIKVTFGEGDVVKSVEKVDPKLAQNVDIVTRKTPTAGKEFTAVQQFVGNLGKFNKADKAKGQ